MAWCDPATGLGGNHRMGNELNRDTANLWCGVYQRGGARFRSNGEDLPLVRLHEAGRLRRPAADRAATATGCYFVLDGEGCRIEFEIEDVAEPRCTPTRRPSPARRGRPARSSPTTSTSFCRVRGTVYARRCDDGGRRAGLAGPLVGGAALGQLRVEPEFRGGARRDPLSLRLHGRHERQLLPGRGHQSRRARSRCRWRRPACWCTSMTTPCAARPPRFSLTSRAASATTVRIDTIGGMVGATAPALRLGIGGGGDASTACRVVGASSRRTSTRVNGDGPAGLRPRRGDEQRRCAPGGLMRQPADDRALYYRQLRSTVAAGFPAPAHDAVCDRRGGAGRPDPGRVHRRGGVGSVS